MLKGIPKILPPALLKAMCEMGHADKMVISDGNFPAHTVGKNAIVIRMDGHGVPEVLEAVLKLLPLDTYTEKPVKLMQVVSGDTCETPIWNTYYDLVSKVDARGQEAFDYVERFAFYEEAKEAYVIVITGESALYANVMLQKGVVTE